MNPEELAKYKAMAECLRRTRRENEQLRQQVDRLKQELAALKREQRLADEAFARESQGIFEAIHENHRVRTGREVVFTFE